MTAPPTLNSQKTATLAELDKFLPTRLNTEHTEVKLQNDPTKLQFRFFRIDEIGESSPLENRLAMSNVIAGVTNSNAHSSRYNLVYLLSGKPEGISLYIGVTGETAIEQGATQLKSAFEGNFAGAKLVKADETLELNAIFNQSKQLGMVYGLPSEDEQLDQHSDIQGVERLINALSGERWQMVIVVEQGSREDIDQTLRRLCNDASDLSENLKRSMQYGQQRGSNEGYSKGQSSSESRGNSVSTGTSNSKGISESKGTGTNKGTTTSQSSSNNGSSLSTTKSGGESQGTSTSESKGTTHSASTSKNTSQSYSQNSGTNESHSLGTNKGESRAVTTDRVNKLAEMVYRDWDDIQIPRFQQGLGKGMYRTAVYLCCENEGVFNRLSSNVASIYQGNRPMLYPLQIEKRNVKQISLKSVLQIRGFPKAEYLRYQHNIPLSSNLAQSQAATWLTAQELGLYFGLPNREVAGLKLRKSVSFAINNNTDANKPHFELGRVIQDGRELANKPLLLAKDVLDKHIFVTGVTGSGKTTTCMKLLIDSGVPFTVIEPAKTEYRALYQNNPNIHYYALGNERLSTFRLNPFELVSKEQNLSGHIGMLKATLTAVFPMEASMPFIVEKAIERAYEKKGWDIALNINYFTDDPWQTEENVFPTFSDMIDELDGVIRDAKMGQEFTEKYRGSLVSRLESLTSGIRGVMINTPRSIDFDKLLDQPTVFELEELKDEEDKAFFMGLIIGRLAECIKHRHSKQHDFRHITLVEEAHRLLAEPKFDDKAKQHGVAMFANLLAEVRKYGESLVIADQIPTKLIGDVIKNTNTKIVHRLFDKEDCNVIGNAILLDSDQKAFLPQLQAGETIVYSGGWHAPIRVQIEQIANTTGKEISPDIIRLQGEMQLWQQRQKIFPNLSQQAVFNTQNFAKSVRSLREQMTSLKRLLSLSEKQPKNAEILWQKFVKITQHIQQMLSIDNETLCKLWIAMLKDCDVYEQSHKWAYSNNNITFETLLNTVSQHLTHTWGTCQQALSSNRYTSDKLLQIFYQRYFA